MSVYSNEAYDVEFIGLRLYRYISYRKYEFGVFCWHIKKGCIFDTIQMKWKLLLYVYNQQDAQFFLWLDFIYNIRSTCFGLYQSIFRSSLFS